MPPLCTAESSQIGKVVEVLSRLCRQYCLTNLVLSFASSLAEAEAVIEIDRSDFTRLLSVADARLWKERWKDSVMRGELISFRRCFPKIPCSTLPQVF